MQLARGIVVDCQPVALVTSDSDLKRCERFVQSLDMANPLELLCLDIGTSLPASAIAITRPHPIAYLQYTSGSSGSPKGVVITHQALDANLRMMTEHKGIEGPYSNLSWLPLYHDMGLIGGVLMPLVNGGHCFLSDARGFVAEPANWLLAMSEWRISRSQAPNFAYRLALEFLETYAKRGLDLSCVEQFAYGSEMIRYETAQRFEVELRQFGLKEGTIFACYGLAEAVLMVSGTAPNQPLTTFDLKPDVMDVHAATVAVGSANVRRYVSCGRPAENCGVRLVDRASGKPIGTDGIVGEIILDGPNIFPGYWHEHGNSWPTQIEAGHIRSSPYWTGDCGFINNGELYIVGRLKDTIKIFGRTLFSSDIEQFIANLDIRIDESRVVAFAVEGVKTDEIVIVAELLESSRDGRELQSLTAKLQASVSNFFDATVKDVVFIRKGRIPRTPNGKLQHAAAKAIYLSGELGRSVLARTHPEPTRLTTSDDRTTLPSRAASIVAEIDGYLRRRHDSFVARERRTIAPHIMLELARLGLLGMQVPRCFGGLEFSMRELLEVITAVSRIDLTLGTFLGVQNALGVRPIMEHGSQEAKERYLPRFAAGYALAAFAVTEDGAGSNPGAMQSRGHLDNNGNLLIDAEKIWIGNAGWASCINLFVRVNGACVGLIIDADRAEVELGAEALTFGMSAMTQNRVHVQDYIAREADILGTLTSGAQVMNDSFRFARAGLVAICLGGIQRCLSLQLAYSQVRNISTGLLAEHPFTKQRISQALAWARILEGLRDIAAASFDGASGEIMDGETAMALKLVATEALWATVDSTAQLLGGRGYIETDYVPQLIADARLLRVFEGPSEVLCAHLGHWYRRQGPSQSSQAWTAVVCSHHAEQLHALTKVSTDTVHLGRAVAVAIVDGLLTTNSSAAIDLEPLRKMAEAALAEATPAGQSNAIDPLAMASDYCAERFAPVISTGRLRPELGADPLLNVQPQLSYADATSPVRRSAPDETVPENSDAFDWLCHWLEREGSKDKISRRDGRRIEELNLDSMQRLNLTFDIERHFKIDEGLLENGSTMTVDELLALLTISGRRDRVAA